MSESKRFENGYSYAKREIEEKEIRNESLEDTIKRLEHHVECAQDFGNCDDFEKGIESCIKHNTEKED